MEGNRSDIGDSVTWEARKTGEAGNTGETGVTWEARETWETLETGETGTVDQQLWYICMHRECADYITYFVTLII